uniref:Adenylate kinase n=1 Tax=Panagrolaimus sp. JU765 TaxID=591449 RepID=A0AC34R2S3_9BILA
MLSQIQVSTFTAFSERNMATIKNQDPEIQLTQGQRAYAKGESALYRGIRAAVLGPANAGRKEQAEMLANKYCVCHLTPDAMFDKEIASGSELGKKIAELRQQGQAIPDELILKVVESNLSRPECRHGYLFDGFPRTIEEAQKIDKVLEQKNAPIDAVIELNKNSNKWMIDKFFGPRNQVGKYYSHRGLHAEINANEPFSEVSRKVDDIFGSYVKNQRVGLESASF